MSLNIHGMTKSSSQLYRDCLRLIKHIAGTKSNKSKALQVIVKGEFKKNAQVSDPIMIENLKSNAIRGLANYLMIESSNKDKKLKDMANAFALKESKNMDEENK
eukprot:gene8966-12094_t